MAKKGGYTSQKGDGVGYPCKTATPVQGSQGFWGISARRIRSLNITYFRGVIFISFTIQILSRILLPIITIIKGKR